MTERLLTFYNSLLELEPLQGYESNFCLQFLESFTYGYISVKLLYVRTLNDTKGKKM